MSSKEMRKNGRGADARLQRQNSQYRQNLREFESSNLSRQPSQHRGSRLPDRDGSKLVDPSKLTRTSTFHTHRTSSSGNDSSPSASKKSSYYKHQTSESNDLSRKASFRNVRSSSSDKHNTDRPSSSQLTDLEKKERKRRQNTESARRTRERKRAEMERLEMVYDANELRIKELELMADELSRELRRHNTISDPRRDSYAFDSKEERPKWFGAPF